MAINPILNELSTAVQYILKESIVMTATDEGLLRYEKIFGLSEHSELEIRRFRIASKLNNKSPFTENWLRDKLNTDLKEGEYNVVIDYADQSILVEVDAQFAGVVNDLESDLRESIPANMVIRVTVKATIPMSHYFGFIVQVGDMLSIT